MVVRDIVNNGIRIVQTPLEETDRVDPSASLEKFTEYTALYLIRNLFDFIR